MEGENKVLADEVDKLKGSLGEEKEKYLLTWRKNCQQLIEYDDIITAKKEEIRTLRAHINSLSADSGYGSSSGAAIMGEKTPPVIPAASIEVNRLGSVTRGISHRRVIAGETYC